MKHLQQRMDADLYKRHSIADVEGILAKRRGERLWAFRLTVLCGAIAGLFGLLGAVFVCVARATPYPDAVPRAYFLAACCGVVSGACGRFCKVYSRDASDLEVRISNSKAVLRDLHSRSSPDRDEINRAIAELANRRDSPALPRLIAHRYSRKA